MIDASLTASMPDVVRRLSIEQVLNSLSPRHRTALVLRELEGLDYSEMAQVLAIPLGTVRSRLAAAREQFRTRWTALDGEVDRL